MPFGSPAASAAGRQAPHAGTRRCGQTVAGRRSVLVYLAAVPDPEHEDDQTVILDRVHDPVVADARAPTSLIAAAEQRDPWRTGVDGQQLDCCYFLERASRFVGGLASEGRGMIYLIG